MQVGVDIDGTITHMPEFFSFLTTALVNIGHRVYLISYRQDTPMIRILTEIQLKQIDVKYTKLFLSDRREDAHIWKGKLAKKLRLDIMFENDVRNLAEMPARCKRVLVGDMLGGRIFPPGFNLVWNGIGGVE